MSDEIEVGYTKVTKKEKEIEQRAKEARSLANPLVDDSDSHIEINNKIAKKYPLNTQIALIRHALKTLLDKEGVTDKEFNDFNDECETIVEKVKENKTNNG